MLYGEFRHTIDDKGRVSLPAKFRAELGDHVVVTKGLDKCIFVHSHKAFEELVGRVGTLSLTRKDSRDFSRTLLAGSNDAEVDSHGRILLPANLREFAGLEREAVWIGVGGRAEVWDPVAYESFRKKAESEYESIAEKLLDVDI